MAEEGGNGISEKELTCAICTEILYQPLTLLDCLHTFCGACLKEWFKWQATSASHNRRVTSPYTCPSCRESVRRTKADWRLNTLLEGFLKAKPDKVKSEEEKQELKSVYKPGEDVLPPVQHVAAEDDSEDERLLAEVREMSMANVDPETARRRAERDARHRRRHQQAQLTESRLRQHNAGQPQIEHQPSLRSLLSASEGDPQDVQAEILRSIYADGLLDGVDLDNMTTEQEEELTEKIAEAYRRRQRQRDRSGNREHRHRESRSQRPATSGAESISPQPMQREVSNEQQQQSRSRPPISRPHLFENNLQEPTRSHRRSHSSTSHRSAHSESRRDDAAPAARSATDLSQQPSTSNAQRERHSRQPSARRSSTAPDTGGSSEPIHQQRASNDNAAQETQTARIPNPNHRAVEPIPRQIEIGNEDIPSIAPLRISPRSQPVNTVRPAVSTAAFAPEVLTDGSDSEPSPSISCSRCNTANIQHDLHYNCRWCRGGDFNLCLDCYRSGQGCDHWFGFGFRAIERWYRNAPSEGWPIGFDRPHNLDARRYTRGDDGDSKSVATSAAALQEGAFCEACLSSANDCYWYCNVCLEGAWGFCDTCLKQGRHCTHPLLAVAHISTIHGTHNDPTKFAFVGLPHLRQDSYVNLPLSYECAVCQRLIPPNSSRLHCYQCSSGDYDVCNECYRGLVAQGKISQANGPNGWRRCLNGHRMVVIGFQDTSEGGHLRMTVRELVGGWSWKEDDASKSHLPSAVIPPDGGVGRKCLALYNYFPKQGVVDELSFPKNAQIREVEDKNGDWFVGVYAGVVNLFPSNHVRLL